MQDNKPEDINPFYDEQEGSFDLRAELYKVLGYWKYFTLSVLIALIVAFLFLRYTTPIYEVSCTVLIKDDSKTRYASNNIISELDAFKQLSNIQNEIGVLHSKTLSRKTVRDYGLYVTYYYYTNKLNRRIELFDDCPFKIIVDTTHVQLLNTPIKINFISNNEINLEISDFTGASEYHFSVRSDTGAAISLAKVDTTIELNKEFINASFSFKIRKNPNYPTDAIDVDKNYFCLISDPDAVGESYAGSIETNKIDDNASIVKITQRTTLPSKSVKYLNALAETYINLDLEYKNLTASRTIEFIDEQLGFITDSLYYIEDILEKFRTKNKTIDLSAEYSAILSKLEEQDKEKVKTNIEIKYYEYILNYLNTKSEYMDIVSPSFLGITDANLSTLVTELVSLSTEKNKMSISSTANNPYFANLENNITLTKKALIEQITNSLNLSQITLTDVKKRIYESEAAINKLPGTERDLLTIQRKFDVNDETYSFLLEKKAEASISKASNLSNHRIVDSAELVGKVYPQSTKIYLIALLIGLILPYLIIRIRDYLNDTIQDKKDIESQTKLPIIGLIAHSSYDKSLVIIEKPRSMVSETIRSVKANMDFLSTSKSKLITLTSTVGGEGKTFCSINLASAIAISDSKILLIGADLRRPKIIQDFNLSNDKGLTSYLIGKSTLDEIINKTSVNNLDIIAAGPVPPNPAELLGSDKMQNLIGELRNKYEYIIIDTPPLGIVTDALFLMKHADINIYMTRFNYTSRKVIKDVNDLVKTTGVKNVCFLLNDVIFKKSKYGKYSRYSGKYGYAYTYSDGYYEE